LIKRTHAGVEIPLTLRQWCFNFRLINRTLAGVEIPLTLRQWCFNFRQTIEQLEVDTPPT
ncbi:MAG TPA: hypothetical protein VI306_01575, partial [Pyrinomonadaceae bacterium]